MADTTVTSPRPRKRRGWRVLIWLVLILIVLIAVAYFVGTSSAFVKAVVLPRVSNSLHADVTVSGASVHPFSEVVLRDLKVQPRGREPLLTAPEVRARYSLLDILRGTIRVDDITVTSPTIHVIETPGGSNLDPLKGKEEQPKPKAPSKEPSKPTRIDLRKLTVSNATIRREKLYANGSQEITELTNVSVTLSNLKNGDSGKLTFSAGASYQTNSPPPGDRGILQGSLNGEFLFALSPDLRPLSLKGQSRLAVTRAEGPLADFGAAAANLDADVDPTEIRQVALRFEKGGASLGEVHVSGPLDLEKLEGQLKVELVGVDKRLLNLFGSRSDMDFGTTTLQSTNQVKLANAGGAVTVAGQFTAAKVAVTRANQTTPTLDLRADYDVSVDRAASTALIRAFTLTGTQNQQPLLSGMLARPMTIAWGDASSGVGDSALNVVVTNLNLGDWKPFAGSSAPEGIANTTLGLLSQAGGKRLTFDLDSHISRFSAQLGENHIQQADVALQARGQATDLKQFTFDEYQLQVSRQNQPALTVTGSGTYNRTNANATVQAAVRAELTRLAALVLPASNRQLPATPVDAKLQIALQNQVLDLRQFDVALAPTQRATNQLQAQGRVNLARPDAIEGNLKLTADSLDLTDYYDLMAGRNKTGAAPAAAPRTTSAPAPAAGGPQPAATSQLPFRNFVMNAAIGRLYLREVEVTNFQTTATVNGSKASLAPLQFALNGAPVNATADLDLSVPGSQYALAFDADHIPFAPLVNTFEPERKGELAGTLSAHLHISGVGTGGESLQKSLTGNFNIGTTNLNLDPAKIRSPMLRLLVSIVSKVPQLAQNPQNATELATGLVGNLFGRNSGGGAGDITHSPIDVITFRGTAGDGRVELQDAVVRSIVFQATAHGTVTLAPVLTNSAIQVPVSLALNRPIAERLGITSANADTNAGYVPLPDFFTETGTIGDPKPKIEAKALTTGALQKLGNKLPIPGIGGTNAGNLLQGIGNLGNVLGGRRGGTNPPSGPTTNAPASNQNQNPVGNLLDLLGPKRK